MQLAVSEHGFQPLAQHAVDGCDGVLAEIESIEADHRICVAIASTTALGSVDRQVPRAIDSESPVPIGFANSAQSFC
jgi:hypothetical protein